MHAVDLIIRSTVVAGQESEGLQDIAVEKGLIRAIGSELDMTGAREIRADGALTSMGFVDSHVHLDKCLTQDRLSHNTTFKTLRERITHSRELKKTFTADDVHERSKRALQMSLATGTTTVRTYVEADPIVGTAAVEGVLRTKAAMKELVTLQTIAFPQEGWISGTDLEMDSKPYIVEALQMGCDAVGGNINTPVWESDARKQVEDIFALADEYNLFVDMHLDNYDNGVAFTLPYVLDKTEEHGLQGRVAGGHVAGLTYVPDELARRTIERVYQLSMTICVLPIRIRLTRVHELMEAGANVTCASDNMRDAFTGMGTGNMLHYLNLLAHVMRQSRDHQLEALYETATTNAAKALGLEDQLGMEAGKSADLVILDCASRAEAIRTMAKALYVVKEGRLVAQGGALVV